MSAPFIGAATSAVALGLSPWILPLIAIAAKRKEGPARRAGPGRILLAWWRGTDKARTDPRARTRPRLRRGSRQASKL
jgi:hypothetical protein